MKTDAQLHETIDRFRRVFWNKESVGRPPLGVVNTNVFLPVKYLKSPFSHGRVVPSDVNSELVLTDYEYAFSNRPVNIDDWMPFSAAWRGIPWLEAWCGCPVNYSSGSLAPGHIFNNIQELNNAPLPACEEWFECLHDQILQLSASAPDDCWISPTILRGGSDVLSALLGMEGLSYDLMERPEEVEIAAERINSLLIRALDQHFSLVKPKHGGYGHIFGYWAPEPTVAIQEDMCGLCDPSVYREIFWKLNSRVVEHLGSYVIFHLHSTGFQHYKDVLEIPGLAGLQMVIESNGPSMMELLPLFREVLDRSRLIIFADNRTNELAEVLRKLPTGGLNVVVPETFIKSDTEYKEFLSAVNWKD